MRISFIQTYPIYHDLVNTSAWLNRINRDRFMPGILSGLGIEVELWAADHKRSSHTSEIKELGSYPIQLFDVSSIRGPTKKHYSDSLVKYAKDYKADLHILKGIDGGVGLRLLEEYLLPNNLPFVFIIGGKYYTKHVHDASIIFYETDEQKQKLLNPDWQIWRKSVPEEKLIKLPKSVDTNLFEPIQSAKKEWDIICVGRLINHYKNYDALGKLSNHFNIAIVGGGPAKKDLEKAYPNIEWLGQVPNSEIPNYLNQAHAFMHPGERDYYPRVLAEAAACGCVLLGFSTAIAADVIRPECGLRLGKNTFVEEVQELFSNPDKMYEMGKNARSYAVDHLHKFSTLEPQKKMLNKLFSNHSNGKNIHFNVDDLSQYQKTSFDS